MEKAHENTPEPEQSGDEYEEVITTHINADFDALASMIAASKLYPNAALVFPGSQEKNLRNFFVHSTSYLFNFAKLRQIRLNRIKRLILVDTRQRDRIGKFAGIIGKKDLEIHIYDHHPDSEDDVHGDIEVIRKIGSNTALLTGLIRERGIEVSPIEATIMCLGIHEDTGSFTFSSTTPEDYLAAAWLAQMGADHNVVADLLTRELTTEQVWILNDLTLSATTHVINGVDIVITEVIRDDYVGDFAVLVHKFMDMENLNVTFALAQMEDRTYLVARSRIPDVNVGEIAVALGGGGHPQAASATVKDKTLVQVKSDLLGILKSAINPKKTAADMMSSPVLHIAPEETVQKASDIMTRYNINVLLVIGETGRLLGYVTRQVVEKAVFFGLNHIKVADYMNIEFSTVRPEATLKEVQELIIRTRLRILPVVQDEEVVGVITRTDLLTILMGDQIEPESFYDAKTAPQLPRKKNMISLLNERLPDPIMELLRRFGRVADDLQFNAYLVGGMVRDILLKRDNLDMDIVVEGDGIEFAHEYARIYGGRVRSHRKFRTAVLILPDTTKVDIATARMEYYEAPGAPPIVETSSLKMDLYRRDFTINTLAVKLNERHFGVLIDYFGAQKDFKERVLRVLHNLSFVEDPTRILRAIRFEQRFGFKIGKLTLSLIKNAVRINCFKDVSGQRLFHELKLLLMEQNPIGAIEQMDAFNLLPVISPQITLTDTFRNLLEEIENVLAWYRLLYLDEPFDAWKLYWHGLTSALDPENLRELAKRFGMNDLEGRALVDQREQSEELLNILYRFQGDAYRLYCLLTPYHTETLLYLMARANNERVRKLISNYFTRLKGTRLHLRGRDLLQMGFESGPLFRDMFEALMEAHLNGHIKTRQDEIDFVLEHYHQFLGDRFPDEAGTP